MKITLLLLLAIITGTCLFVAILVSIIAFTVIKILKRREKYYKDYTRNNCCKNCKWWVKSIDNYLIGRCMYYPEIVIEVTADKYCSFFIKTKESQGG